ncbi:thiamine phosphate synthase [Chlamydia psittaci]|uniref:Thiamine-phosphate synthase n=1 Tax=Chlamydia psittaci 99DC5 TaxID=1112251 RepID=A0ABN0MQ06_CHLPS|nr:thiamine phosphate synthase [Chlamydia psittaci]AFS19208.1 thiamine-phosphate pyrophosphorylase [Chlamydia psittaci 84/55]AFS22406.1 thiamine-phosphate pyrophosphorylase [Chlamydia psittaci VS225]AGE74788.1 thiamine-phosphate pyrophosphorylase [Chlamydia psittaci Mat116]EPJ16034.1 thiamine-phosphate pyrophosphorylase [Chlamydia psittaci 02DC18]EPJ25481.1 thiamine-phosphate pyrophosphorylase [Chlamydia psittaci 09DC77]EPJ30540.1 thiamine-phosphate pyrophosphorylase [Chlamydia psittaci 09DC7
MEENFFKLILITNKQNISVEEYLDFVCACVHSGVTSVQLREKELSYRELLGFGEALKSMLDPLEIPLIVSDSVSVCLDLDATGVHLGQTDGDVIEARELLGSDKIIGWNVNTLDQLLNANTLPIDYLGLSAMFATQNKPDATNLWGFSGLEQAVSLCEHPIVAIGGIDESNAAEVIEAGAAGIAAIGVFHSAQNPGLVTKTLREIVDRGLRC